MTRRRQMANEILNTVGGLQSLNMILYMYLEKLNQCDRKENATEHELQHQMRMTLNILINFMIYNNEDPSVAQEFTNS